MLAQAEDLCDRLAVMAHGRILAVGTRHELYEQWQSKDLREAFFKIIESAHETADEREMAEG